MAALCNFALWFLLLLSIHRVSKKNVPPLQLAIIFTYSSIATIFGTNVAQKVGNQNILYFPTTPN